MFTRVHRSFIVNNTKVKAVDPIQVHLINDAAVPVGASYKSELKNFEM
jgi:DNA-binding LytR/AlgR family response regulator